MPIGPPWSPKAGQLSSTRNYTTGKPLTVAAAESNHETTAAIVRPVAVRIGPIPQRSGKRMADRKHENRFFDTLTINHPSLRRDRRLDAPRVHLDGELGQLVQSELLGPLGDELAGAYVCIEHWSTPPDGADVHKTLLKTALIRHSLNASDRLAMVVACKGSIGAFRRLSRTEVPNHRGWWRALAGHGELHLISAVRLASDGTWGALRFALNPPGAPDQDLFAELLGDPRLTTITRTRLEEAIVNQQISNIEERVRDTAWQRAQREGQLDRDVELLASLRPLLGSDAIAGLESAIGSDRFVALLAEAVASWKARE
jgi:hypothetical protein